MASKSISATAPSRTRAVEVVVDSKLAYNGSAFKSPKYGNGSSKSDEKRLLLHSDSGYISPTVAPASNGNSPQTPSKGLVLKFQATGTIAEDQKSAVETDSVVRSPPLVSENLNSLHVNHQTDSMQTVVRPSRENQTEYKARRRSLPAESPMEEHCFIHEDLLLLAYECRQTNTGAWSHCQHPYCVFIRLMSQHFNSYRDSHNHTCEKCSNFVDMLNKHISSCSNAHCPIQMCRSARNQYPATLAQFQFKSRLTPVGDGVSRPAASHSKPQGLHILGRSSSFGAADTDMNSSMSSLLSSRGIVPVISNLTRATLRARAEEIVNRLDEEEPFLSSSSGMLIPDNHHGPMSLPSESTPYQIGVQQQLMLSPIAEQPGTEDISPSYSSMPPFSHHGSQPQFSSLGSGYSSCDMDGPGHTSMDRASAPPQSIKLGSERTQEPREQEPVSFPKQRVIHPINKNYLTPGEKDGLYYKIRDYNMNEVDLLGSGGFGSCMCAQDNTTNKMFAIKQNKNECYKSIECECFVLSHLSKHDHIIQFLGAVVEERESPTQPPEICKMMMELAEHGNLAEMLKDEAGREAPLPGDQSLYYLQQILEGVNFLHQSCYLHLDIKAQNVLVFDGGRTVKLTDFGTAVAVGEATVALKGWTPYFVAPEIIKGEVPSFSADIWSVMCVLIEMLTAEWPGCHQGHIPDMSMMFLVGHYEDDQINRLVPLDSLEVEPDVKQLFKDVLKKDPKSRPTAMDLLQKPVISSAYEYGPYFDESFNSEDAEEFDSIPPQTANFVEMDSDTRGELSHVSLDSCHSFNSIGDVVGELPQFVENQNPIRGRGGSQDSGVGGDLENSVNGALYGPQLSMRSSSTGSAAGQSWLVHQDSGLEDIPGGECPLPDRPAVCVPVYHMDFCPVNYRPRSGSLNKSTGYSNKVNFSSLPSAPSVPQEYTTVQRSYSFGGRPMKRSDSSYRSQSRATAGLNHVAKRQRPNSIHPKLHLTHSQSAPSIGLNPWRRRRHSLQHIDSYGRDETWEADAEVDGINPRRRGHLRRTSSEVYVDRGPDIDTPEKEKIKLQELLSDLHLGSAPSPKHSARSSDVAESRQTTDAGIQCDPPSINSSSTSSSSTSNELSESKKQSEDSTSGDHDDDPPPANGSQAFQIC